MDNGQQVLTALAARMGDKVDKDLKRFDLISDEEANATDIGENFAASNIGLSCKDDLDGIEEECYPHEEIEAWVIRAKRAIALCKEYGLPPTNRNVIIMHWHKGVI